MPAHIEDKEALFRVRLGKRIKRARKQRGLKQYEVADRMGIHRTQYSKIESGYAQIKIHRFLQICDILGKCANSMLGRKRRKPA